jgi:predicted RND superfamily exporter protein
MIKNNLFYLLLVFIFLILSALSFYWFNNVDSYTNTYSAQNNPILENSVKILYKFNVVLDFLDILGDNSLNEKDYNKVNSLATSIEKSSNTVDTFTIAEQLKNDKKLENVNNKEGTVATNGSEVIEIRDFKEKKWYQKFSQYLSKIGLFAFKKDNYLKLGWQSFKGKIYSINIPY